MRQFAGRQIGKVGGGQRLQVEARAPRAQQQLADLARHFERDLRALGQLAHDIVEDMGGDGGGAFHSDVGGRRFRRLEVEIGRLQRQLALARLEQDVRQDRDRVAPLDDAMHMPQSLQQGRSLQRHLHRNIPISPANLCPPIPRGCDFGKAAADPQERRRRKKRILKH